MSNVSFNNTYVNNKSNPELQKRLESQENFGAVDTEKIKQDTVELGNKAKKEVKENFIFRTLKNTFGVEDPKKTLTSIGLTIATVVGGAVLGNKLSNPTARLGVKVDEFAKNNKIYSTVGDTFNSVINRAKSFLKKSKTIQDISSTMKIRPAKAKADFARGYGRGFVSIFSLTPVDILQKAFKKAGIEGNDPAAIQKATNLMKKLVGDNENASSIAKQLLGAVKPEEKLQNRALCQKLSDAMRSYLGCGKDNKAFEAALEELQKGIFKGQNVSEFIGVDMVEKGPSGLISSWWPVNIINSIGKKIRKDKWKGFGRGNLGDSLVKFNAVNGTLADTKIGSLIQKSTTVPLESVTNFVNDKSGLGVFLCSSIMSLYNNVQDAPKEKRAATIADDYIGTIGSIAISTPLAYATTYGLASLKNLEGKTIFSKGLKMIGKFFGMGLDKYVDGKLVVDQKNWKNFLPRKLGGALRLFMIMFILGPKFAKPIQGLIHKIFGKPYDKNEEERLKQLEEQKKQVIPELGITQGELMEKIQKNPKVIERLQTDPNLAQQLNKNPKLLLDLLDGKDINTKNKPIDNSKGQTTLSPINAGLINKGKINQSPKQNLNQNQTSNERDLFSKKEAKKESTEQTQAPIDTATYIPSSDFVASPNLNNEQKKEIDAIIAKSDKILEKAEKFI